MYEYLNNNFRVGPGLAKSIKNVISSHRPVGGPSQVAKKIKGRLKI